LQIGLQIADLIRDRGPMTVAAFMDFALYDPEFGYYARADQRSGRAGDFFTSVDVGPLFGELLEIQLAEMSAILNSKFHVPNFSLVEAGAGNGRLSADILRAARARDPRFYDAIQLHLVEASAGARAAQRATLGDVAERLTSSDASLPCSFDGVLIANELLDALPVHQVVMREEGLRETYVISQRRSVLDTPERHGATASASDSLEPLRGAGAEQPRRVWGPGAVRDGRAPRDVKNDDGLTIIEGPPSTPMLAEYLARLGAELQPGWRAEINLRAVEWIRDAARRLRRGFIILIDYGHEARELFSPTHATGTLATYSAHRSVGSESAAATPAWLQSPGEQDITSHVDFTSVRAAAEEEGLQTLGFLDQTYFLLGLLGEGRAGRYEDDKQRRALKTLVMPGGLGSTHKILIFGKGVGTPALCGCSYKMRVT
jgi:SAM-dependent MidA family methyltransferase